MLSAANDLQKFNKLFTAVFFFLIECNKRSVEKNAPDLILHKKVDDSYET